MKEINKYLKEVKIMRTTLIVVTILYCISIFLSNSEKIMDQIVISSKESKKCYLPDHYPQNIKKTIKFNSVGECEKFISIKK